MGRRGVKPMPTALKKLKGTYRATKAAKSELVTPEGAPEVPDWLDARAVEEWNRVVPPLAKARVLTHTDKEMLASYCAAVSLAQQATIGYQKEGLMVRTGPQGKLLRKNPLIKVAQDARAQLMRIGAEFGLSPAARTRVSMPDPEKPEDDKDEDFLFKKPTLVPKVS